MSLSQHGLGAFLRMRDYARNKEYRLQLMDTLKQSDDYFYSIRTPLSIATNVYYNVGIDICHGEYCGNTIRFSA